VDECAVNNGGCDANATCTNVTGAAPTCACNANYSGDGQTCDSLCLGATVIEKLLEGCLDISGADLTDLDLSGFNLSGVKGLLLVTCSGAELPSGFKCKTADAGLMLTGPGADLSGADLTGADLSGLNLAGANLAGATLTNVDLTGAKLADANVTGATLSGVLAVELKGCPYGLPAAWQCLFEQATGRDLLAGPGANIGGVDLSGASLAGMDLTGADLTAATLSGADLTGVDFTAATLSSVTWKGATCPNGATATENTCCDQLGGKVPAACE